MGRVTIRARLASGAALVLALALAAWPAAPADAFSGFGPMRAEATYGEQMTFSVELPGGAPERLELLLRFGDSEVSVVSPVAPGATSASYVWDASERTVTPNTVIHYRWRATVGERVTLSPEASLLYDDDRPGLDWRTATIGDTVVHWYGGAEAEARQFGQLTAGGVARGEALLGHQLDGPIDIFVYDSRDDFFGALGPGAREWTGAAAYPEIRTIFMWLGGGSADYLETAIVHEVTHVVFHDATLNPFHEPPAWFNEGLASWSETESAAGERAQVRAEASSGLFAFQAIENSFPISDRGARLAYSQGATMIEMIIDEHGREAIARISAAWRDGATDAEALEAGTGVSADQLYAAFFEAFGVEPPAPIEPAPIGPSVVVPPDATPFPVPSPGASPVSPGDSQDGHDGEPADAWLWPLVALVVIGLVAAGVFVGARRSARAAQ